MKRLNQSGSHLLALLVGLVVIGGISFAGYTVVHHQNATSSAGTPVATSNDNAPASIKTTADLTATAHALDTASGQVDGSLNDNSLNSDLNDLL
jgi:endonuclease V-like protein UPF0215 family